MAATYRQYIVHGYQPFQVKVYNNRNVVVSIVAIDIS